MRCALLGGGGPLCVHLLATLILEAQLLLVTDELLLESRHFLRLRTQLRLLWRAAERRQACGSATEAAGVADRLQWGARAGAPRESGSALRERLLRQYR